jgi:hypothetical protein
MKFVILNPDAKSMRVIDVADMQAAKRQAHLDKVDFGSISHDPGIGIVVYEFGLCEPGKHKYFALNKQLYAGAAVLFGFDAAGDTIDVPLQPELREVPINEHGRCIQTSVLWRPDGHGYGINWLADEAAVEMAITAKVVARPTVSINGRLIAEWPNLDR